MDNIIYVGRVVFFCIIRLKQLDVDFSFRNVVFIACAHICLCVYLPTMCSFFFLSTMLMLINVEIRCCVGISVRVLYGYVDVSLSTLIYVFI